MTKDASTYTAELNDGDLSSTITVEDTDNGFSYDVELRYGEVDREPTKKEIAVFEMKIHSEIIRLAESRGWSDLNHVNRLAEEMRKHRPSKWTRLRGSV